MESGSREGEELRKVWSKLRQEEAAWLEEEVQSSFQQEADDQVPGCKPCLVVTVAFPVGCSTIHLFLSLVLLTTHAIRLEEATKMYSSL